MNANLKPEQWPVEPDAAHIGSLAAALAKAQGEMQNPAFDSANPHFKNRFASLAAVRNSVVPVLAKHGISMCQDLQTIDGGIACTTILTHSSGQQMRFGPLVLPATKADPQGFGSCATYARRYALMAVAGVVGDDDDDGNAGSKKERTEAPAIHQDVWVSLQDASKLGEKALRDAWKQLSEETRGAISTYHTSKWEVIKSHAVAQKGPA